MEVDSWLVAEGKVSFLAGSGSFLEEEELLLAASGSPFQPLELVPFGVIHCSTNQGLFKSCLKGAEDFSDSLQMSGSFKAD